MKRIFQGLAWGLLALFAVAVHAESQVDDENHPAGVPSHTFSDAVKGYAWAHDESSASYTISGGYSYNVSGGAITAIRSSVGTYTIRFAGLGSYTPLHVQVTAYASTASCVLEFFGATDVVNVEADVTCRDIHGDFVDSRYTIMIVSSFGASVESMAFAWANNAANGTYTPTSNASYNGSGGAIIAMRNGTGQYTMRFQGMGGYPVSHVQVTAYGFNVRCQVRDWAAIGADLIVSTLCFKASGTPVDSLYTVLLVGYPGENTGYAWAMNHDVASYTPDPRFSGNLEGAITASRSGVGTYQMQFDGLGGETAGGMVVVSTYGADFANCNISGWVSYFANFTTRTSCFNQAGNPMDSRYTVLVVWPDRPRREIFSNSFESLLK